MNLRKLFYGALYCISVFTITAILISCSKENKTSKENKSGKETKSGDTSVKKENNDTSGTTTLLSGTSSGTATAGKELFYMKSSVNNIACADCHSDGTNTANPLTKYFSNIQGASKRTSTYNGKFTGGDVIKHAGGATVCWTTYMRMKTPMTEAQIQDLNNYFESNTAANPPSEIKYETIALPTRNKAKLKEVQNVVTSLKGDPVKGEQVFYQACGTCHGENATVKKVPTVIEEFEGNVKSITYNVRLGDASMPFFKTETLSDQDLADVCSYILQRSSK